MEAQPTSRPDPAAMSQVTGPSAGTRSVELFCSFADPRVFYPGRRGRMTTLAPVPSWGVWRALLQGEARHLVPAGIGRGPWAWAPPQWCFLKSSLAVKCNKRQCPQHVPAAGSRPARPVLIPASQTPREVPPHRLWWILIPSPKGAALWLPGRR